MLSFFRRIIYSKVGVAVTLAVLVVIAVAFGLGDVTGLRHGATGGLTPDSVAKVGGVSVTAAELRDRAKNELDSFRQQQPTLDMRQFVAGGGLEGTLQRIVNGLAMEAFARDSGMVASKRLIDGQIASIPGLQGPDGKFNQSLYQSILAQRQISDAQIRSDMARDIFARQLVAPTVSASYEPSQLATPYASLALEKRSGEVAFVPIEATMPKGAPSDQDIAQFYAANRARYTVPERRVIRYAMATPASVAAQAQPSPAEIAAAYQAQAASYRPSEKRNLEQVVLLDQNAANALAAKVKGGGSIKAAAQAAGLEAASLPGVTKADYAGQTSAPLADAVFAAAKGAVVGPVKVPLGYAVVSIDAITHDPGKTLEQATPQLRDALVKLKTVQVLGALHDKLDDAINNRGNFGELATAGRLQAQVTPAVVKSGVDPDHPEAKPDPTLAQVVAAGFAAEPGDDPQLVATGNDGSFALVALDRVVSATPRPLAQIRDQVARDLTNQRAGQAAQSLAKLIAGKVSGQATLAQAVASAGVALSAPKPLDASRAQLMANPQGAPPALALLFSMPQGSTRTLQSADGKGWYVLHLDRIVAGNPANDPRIAGIVRAQLGQSAGAEYAQQFTEAVRRTVGVKQNDAAIARVRGELMGQAPPQP